jgi:excisionase family DNA binding protein
MSKQLRTVEQAADDLSVSVHTIRAWIARRKIAHVRLGRAIRVPVAEIVRLVEEGTVPVATARIRRVV